tara:strand:- start:38579 stop:38827 length:249 start_codon:yes stop_codon:yes gene_type:complete
MTQIQIQMPPELATELAEIRRQLSDLSARIAPEQEYLTTTDVARIRRISEHTVRKMVREGKLPCKRDGRKMLFRPADINPAA